MDYRNKQTKLFQMNIELGDKVIIGSGKGNNGKKILFCSYQLFGIRIIHFG